ncbi:MAG: hypothetical protein ACRDX8_04685 [Acidimicrobiales bacterium]
MTSWCSAARPPAPSRPAYDEEFRSRLAEAAGAPVVGVLSSVVAELASAGAVALFTPYVEALTSRIRDSLLAGGIPVVTTACLGLRQNLDIGALTPDEILASVTAMNLSDAKVLFCSCTNLRAYEAIDPLQAKTGLPVVTSNQAVVAQLRALTEIPDQTLAHTPK